MIRFDDAREFVYTSARLLERRLFETLFEGAPAEGVVDALRGYRNPDGGFGHALEPDKRAPESQPLDVQFAFETMDAAGAFDHDLARAACDWLATIGDGLPIVLPSVADYPRANHWADGRFPPGVWGTAAIAGLLWKHGVEHPWRERAAAWCLADLEREIPDDAHEIRDCLVLATYAPGGERVRVGLAERLPTARWFLHDPEDTSYGLSPLEFRDFGFFSDDELQPWLDRVERDQQDDGGWPITWEPPGAGAALEWRGYVTVRALATLREYGRAGTTGRSGSASR